MALVITLAMVLGMMSMTAFAADDFTLTINNTVEGHTYSAYQIFKGSKADHSQVQYVAASTYAEGTTYYYKNGADYDVIEVADAQAFGTISATQTLYTRTGNSGLGNVTWGADITDAGKQALYTAYGMTVDATDLDAPANINALIDAIADVDTTTLSESDKAVRMQLDSLFYVLCKGFWCLVWKSEEEIHIDSSTCRAQYRHYILKRQIAWCASYGFKHLCVKILHTDRESVEMALGECYPVLFCKVARMTLNCNLRFLYGWEKRKQMVIYLLKN